MTCKDCFLYDGCIAGHLHCYDEEGIKKNCKSFKNKNNYLEVVRCSNCKFLKSGRTTFGIYAYCESDDGLKNIFDLDACFCCYGDKKG